MPLPHRPQSYERKLPAKGFMCGSALVNAGCGRQMQAFHNRRPADVGERTSFGSAAVIPKTLSCSLYLTCIFAAMSRYTPPSSLMQRGPRIASFLAIVAHV